MSWGSKTTLTGLGVALSEVTNTDTDYTANSHYTQWVTLNPGETAHIQLSVAYGSTGNDTGVRIVTTLDDSTESSDTVGMITGVVPFVASTTQQRSMFLTGPYKFRVELRKYGTTAGSYTPNVYIRKNGINV